MCIILEFMYVINVISVSKKKKKNQCNMCITFPSFFEQQRFLVIFLSDWFRKAIAINPQSIFTSNDKVLTI